MALCVACLLAGACVVLDPLASQIAVARLVNPFGTAAWPQMTHLAIRRPVERVARGRAFQIAVVDAYGAPDCRRKSASTTASTRRMPRPSRRSSRLRYLEGVMTARRENVLRPFSYRVEGGDDQSIPWFDVQVVEPPAIEAASVRLVPPAYTGWPPVPAKRNIRALEGTRVEIAASATKPLRSAILCLEGGARIPAQLGGDGRRLSVAFRVEKSGSYWLDLTDREGLGGGSDDRWEIPRHPRHAADGKHRAADGKSLRHAAGRSAHSGGGQG